MSEPQIDVVIGPDAVERLAVAATSAAGSGALVVSDANTREAAGEAVIAALRDVGIAVREHVFAQRDGLLAEPHEAAAVSARIGDLWPVVVGSGVLTDIVRYAAHAVDCDFVSVPTAASMDGYASAAAAMQIAGVKVTSPARAPAGIYADPAVVAAAPLDLTRAGIGDLLAKVTARVDWLAAHLLYDEPFPVAVADRVLGPLRFAAGRASDLLAGDVEATSGLLEGLIESGVAITLAGNTRPASGCEHHASHFWDLLAAHRRRAHASHGLQTGYATAFAMRLQRFAFGGGLATPLRDPVAPADPLSVEARAWLGEPTAELRAAVDEKQRLVSRVPELVARGRCRVDRGAGRACVDAVVVRRGRIWASRRGNPGRAGVARDRRRYVARDVPLREPTTRPLHDDRLPRGPGCARRCSRVDDRRAVTVVSATTCYAGELWNLALRPLPI